MKNKIYIPVIAIIALLTFSCNDFLDKLPDNRTMLDTPEKISGLLVNSYPTANYALIAELSGDNFIDNQAPRFGVSLPASAYDRMDTEIFEWTDVRSSTGGDSPYSIWQSFYQSIASANHALAGIEELLAEGKYTEEEMNPQKGEALVLRAYCHFILVNIFAETYKGEASKNDLGITYMTEPETKVMTEYQRNTVYEVYELIEKDLEEGIPLIKNNVYNDAAIRYHFTTDAAYALGSQFYLYKRSYRKAIEHANKVLGTGNPKNLLRDYNTIVSGGSDQIQQVWISSEAPCNLFLLPTYSVFMRRFFTTRYTYNGPPREITFGQSGDGPNWSNRPIFLDTYSWWVDNQNYGSFPTKVAEFFEYTDRVAGIGYAHQVRTEFTTDDVLLNRAEAKAMLGLFEESLQDLVYFSASHRFPRALTDEVIRSFYSISDDPEVAPNPHVHTFHTTEMDPTFIVTEGTQGQKPYIDCCLHFRRLERILEGHRWFDLKRYGIEISKQVSRADNTITLKWNDPRRAIQIPSDVIGAGLEPNPRPTTTNNSSPMVRVDDNDNNNEENK